MTHALNRGRLLVALIAVVSMVFATAPTAEAAKPLPSGGTAYFQEDCDVEVRSIRWPAGPRIVRIATVLYIDSVQGDEEDAIFEGTPTAPYNRSTIDVLAEYPEGAAPPSNSLQITVVAYGKGGKELYNGTAARTQASDGGICSGYENLMWGRAG